MPAEARGTPDLKNIHINSHPSLNLINHEREHGLPIYPPRGITEVELRTEFHFGMNAYSGKELDFVNHEISEQVQAGHVAIFPLLDNRDLPKLWLSPISVIPQVGRHPWFILDLTWISLNKPTDRKDPKEVMWVGGILHRIIIKVLTEYPRIGPVYLGKVDLANTYIRIWVQIDDTPSVTFIPGGQTLVQDQCVHEFHMHPVSYQGRWCGGGQVWE